MTHGSKIITPVPLRAPKRVGLIAMVVLAIAVVVAYSNCTSNDFALDDWHAITDNPAIRGVLIHNAGRIEGLDTTRIARFFTDPFAFSTLPANVDYRPLLLLTYAGNYEWSRALHGDGYDPRTWHWVNMGLHWLACVGLYFVGSMLIGSGRLSPLPATPARAGDWLSLAAALLFAVHPITSECVNYLCARSSLMPAAFLLVALAIYLGVLAGRLSWWTLAFPFVLLCAALFTKVEAIAFLGVLTLAEMVLAPGQAARPLYRRPLNAASWLRLAPFIAVTIAYLLLWRFMSERAHNPQRAMPEMTSSVYLLTQVRAWWYYIAEAVAPTSLFADDTAFPISGELPLGVQPAEGLPRYSTARALADPRVWLALTGWGAVALVCFRLLRVFPAAFFLLGSFVCFLAPHSSIVPLSEMVNGHRAYLALAGLFILFVGGLWMGARLLTGRPALALIAVVALLCIPLVGLTRERNEVWRTDLSLWRDTATKSPGSGRAQMNYGLALMKLGRYAEAEDRFRRCLSIWPYYSYAHTNLAIVRAARGDPAGAAASHDTAVLNSASDPSAPYWRGQFRARQNNLDGAIDDFRAAIGRNPAAFKEAAALVECLIRTGRETEATPLIQQHSASDPAGFERLRAEFRTAVLGAESSVAVNDRGERLMRQARYLQAEALFRHALELDPRNHLAITNMGVSRGAQGDTAGETQWHDKSVQTAPDDVSPWYWRARCYTARGDLERATSDFRVALTKRGAGPVHAAALAACLIAANKPDDANAVVGEWRAKDPAAFDSATADFQGSVLNRRK